MANLILVLALIAYLLLIPFHIQTPKGTGDQNVGILVTFYIFLAYAALSLILTTIIAFKGGFNWISASVLWRNIGVGLLWLGLVGGAFICMYIKADIGMGNKTTGLLRLLAYMFYYGGVWLPLVLLLSYYSIVNPEWRLAITPGFYKSLILFGSAFGIVSLVMSGQLRGFITANTDEYNTNLAMAEIDKAKSIEEQFWLTTKITDDSLRTVVLGRIKAQPNLEDEIVKLLNLDNQFLFTSIYDFINENPVEHPERLIEPINLNLIKMNTLIQGNTLAPWVGVEGFDNVKIQPILRVMYKYFSDNREPFRENMLTIKHTLETPKERNKGNKDAEQFMAIVNEYKQQVQNWLDGH